MKLTALQKELSIGAVVAFAAAALVFVLTPPERTPGPVLRLVGGEDATPINLYGGTRLGLRLDSHPGITRDEVANRVRQRELGRVARVGDRIAIELVQISPEGASAVLEGLNMRGDLRFQWVENGADFMHTLCARIGTGEDGVLCDRDLWEGRGSYQESDTFLESSSREVLEAAIADSGLSVPVDFEILLSEAKEPPEADADLTENWRSYYLSAEALLTRKHIERAEARRSERGYPEVWLRFTREGGDRFADGTRNNVGRKLAIVLDDVVESAPVVRDEIVGGEAVVSMGAGTPGAALLEARSLAYALNHGGIGATFSIDSVEEVEPNLPAGLLLAARLLFAGLVGVAAFLLTLVARKLSSRARGERSREQADATASSIWVPIGRAAVTAVAIAAAYLLREIPLPMLFDIDDFYFGAMGGWSIVELGIVPLVIAALIVELAAFAPPRWRDDRTNGPAGRARLATANAAIAVGLSVLFGWVYSSALSSASVSMPPPMAQLIVTATLAAGVFAYSVLIALIGRYGLGNGYGIIIGLGLVLRLVESAGDTALAISFGSGPTPAFMLLSLLALFAVAGSTVWILRARVRSPAGTQSMRIPTSGLFPLLGLMLAMQAIDLAANFGLQTTKLTALMRWLRPHRGLDLPYLAVVLALTIGFAFLFSRPRRVAGSARTLKGDIVASPWLLFARATALSGLWFVVLALFHGYFDFSMHWDLAIPIIGTAVSMDIIADASAYRRCRDLGSVWPLHQVDRIDETLEALRLNGITAHAKNAYLRSLFFFFAPFIPVEILVPNTDAERAHEVLAELLAPPR